MIDAQIIDMNSFSNKTIKEKYTTVFNSKPWYTIGIHKFIPNNLCLIKY